MTLPACETQLCRIPTAETGIGAGTDESVIWIISKRFWLLIDWLSWVPLTLPTQGELRCCGDVMLFHSWGNHCVTAQASYAKYHNAQRSRLNVCLLMKMLASRVDAQSCTNDTLERVTLLKGVASFPQTHFRLGSLQKLWTLLVLIPFRL